MRHGRQIGHADSSVQISPHGQRELARGIDELRRFDNFAQGDGLARQVRYFDADGGFAWDALNQNRFGFQREAQIFGQANDAAVFDARFGFEFERRNHWTGVDLSYAPLYIKLLTLFFNRAGPLFQFCFVQLLAAFAFAQQRDGRQFVIGVAFGDLRLASRFSQRGLFRFAVDYEDRRLVASLSFFFRAFLIAFFLPRFENVAFVFQFDS